MAGLRPERIVTPSTMDLLTDSLPVSLASGDYAPAGGLLTETTRSR